MLAGGVGVGIGYVEEVADNDLTLLANGCCEWREDTTVFVFDADACCKEELNAFKLVGYDSHLDDTAESARVGSCSKELLKDGGTLDGHAQRPVLSTDSWVRATRKEDIDELAMIVVDSSGERCASVRCSIVGVDALVEQVDHRVLVVELDSGFDNTFRFVKVCTSCNQLR